jgi:hypothetical protein
MPDKNVLSKHQNRYTLENIGPYRQLFSDYALRLQYYQTKHPELSSYTYPYGSFNNNIEITQQTKNIYRYLSTTNAVFPNPYKTSVKNSFFSQLLKIVSISKETKLLNYFFLLNKSEPDISKEFPLNVPYKESVVNAYINWLFCFGKTIYHIPNFFLSLQAKITPTQAKAKFSSKIPLDYRVMVSSLEKLKKEKTNPDFITDAYRIILHRNPDDQGFKKNLLELDNHQVSREFFLFRLFKSPEFNYKHGLRLYSLLTVYRLWLLLLSARFMLFKPLLKQTVIQSKKHHRPAVANDYLLNTGWNISGYFDTESGVGESARGFIRTFDYLKTPINIINIEQPWLRREDKTYEKRFTAKHDYLINLICVNAEQVKPVIETQLPQNYIANKYNIGYWYWESDIFPESYNESFTPLNEVWTATTYVQTAISFRSPRPVICIPPSFIPPLSSPSQFNFKKYAPSIIPGDFVFLNIFDSASIWQRKNPFSLIEAFTKAFKAKPGVKLLIKTTRIKKSDIYPKLKAAVDQNPQISLVDGYLTNTEMMSLLNSSNCFVSPHRAEGLGVPLINAHFLKKPVIATNFSANKDFETESNTFLVNYKPFVLDKSIGPYPQNTTWADPDIDHLAHQMARVLNLDTVSLDHICQRAQDEVAFHFSPHRVGNLIISRLKTINQFF